MVLTRAWLTEHALPGDGDLAQVLVSLLQTRDAMRAALSGQGEERLNAVLDHGSRRPRLRDGRPYEEVVVDAAEWHAAWLVAADFVHLMGSRPDRVRECANPECVLWFLDVSKNGRRRWCSMETCGNRAKVDRYNQRQRPLT